MKPQKVWVLLMLCFSWLLTWECTNAPGVAGNISQTGNGMVAGMLFEPDGKTPARGAIVYIRKSNILADTSFRSSAKNLTKKAAASADTVLTDTNGEFLIDSVDTGIYVIEAVSGNNRALQCPVIISSPDAKVKLPADTLKPSGAIRGVITLSDGGDPRKVFVFAFGIDRFATVAEDGSFIFSNLAQAVYDIRILPLLDNYGVFDTSGIPVMPADTTALDTISLPFTGIPVVKNITLSYDTLKQIISLSWNSLDTSLISGYKVYRKKIDSENPDINPIYINLSTDTLCQDSTASQDSTYEYCVTALDKQGNEGALGPGVSVTVVGAFSFLKSFGAPGNDDGQFEEPGEIATDSSGNIYVLDPFNTSGKVHKFTKEGLFIKTWSAGKTGCLRDIEVSGSTLYILDRINKSISTYDTSGSFLNSWLLFSDSDPIFISITDQNVFIIDRKNQKVLKHSLEGDSISEWSGVNGNYFNSLKAIAADPEKKQLFILDSDSIGYVMDLSGNLVSKFKIDSRAIVSAWTQWFRLRCGDLIYAGTEKHSVFVINREGQLIARFGVFGTSDGQFNYPLAVTENSFGIYISDAQNWRIQVFRKNDFTNSHLPD